MSTLRVNSVADASGANGSSQSQIVQGRAKAWFNLNGTGVIAPRDDFNVSSYVDNGAGNYTANLASAMPNANYGFSGLCDDTVTSADRPGVIGVFRSSPPTTTALRWMVYSINNANAQDPQFTSITIHGD